MQLAQWSVVFIHVSYLGLSAHIVILKCLGQIAVTAGHSVLNLANIKRRTQRSLLDAAHTAHIGHSDRLS